MHYILLLEFNACVKNAFDELKFYSNFGIMAGEIVYAIDKQTGEIFNKINSATETILTGFNVKIDEQTNELIEVIDAGTDQILYEVNQSTNEILNNLDNV